MYVADLTLLENEWAKLRAMCWSDNTYKAKKTQWRRFLKFCDSYDLRPLPATPVVVCLYVTDLTKTVCYQTIKQYVSGVWSLHKYLGYDHPDPTFFIIQSTLQGAKRLLGAATNPALPLSPQDLCAIFYTLDMSSVVDRKFWAALVLSFRCLLRVSHLVSSPHQLYVRDVEFNEEGFDLVMRSSKTIQFQERVNRIPVVQSPGSILCPVSVIKQYISDSGRKPSQTLFGFSYAKYNAKLQRSCEAIGLKGHYSTHSVRRGSASYLATFLPLHDVKAYGDWRSWSVLLYLSDTYSSRKTKDTAVASELSKFI